MKRNTVLKFAGLSLAIASMIAIASPASAFGPRGEGGLKGHGGPGGGHMLMGGGGQGEHLAEALGISVEELEAARAEAFASGLEQAVEDGRIDQEKADLMLAGQKLRSVIDRKALTAEALGLTVEELEAAHEEGKTLRDLIEEAGLDRDEFREAMQALVEAAIDQAVEDGVITAEEAEALKNAKQNMQRGKRGNRGGGDGPGRGGERGGPRGGDGPVGGNAEDAMFSLPATDA